MGFRRLVLLTHRWLGLASSAVLLIAGVTGAVLVWPLPAPARRIANLLHDSLALGSVGVWVVLIATAGAVVLQAGGLYLWWRNKVLRIRTGQGWRRAVSDVHHVAGVVGLLIMLLIAASAIGRVAGRVLDRAGQHRDVRRTISRLHTAEGFAMPAKVLYTVGSLGFSVQGVTGVLMWWRPRRGQPDRPAGRNKSRANG